jgi:DNA-binding HxlR family transcriptional regulator
MPGQPVRGSRSGAPIMALFDLLGRHWAMGIVWNLNKRLRELRDAGFVETAAGGYRLTRIGRSLYALLVPLGSWSKTWARKLTGGAVK